MKRFTFGFAVVAVALLAPTARADVQRQVFETRREQCHNSSNEFSLEQSIRGCSAVISMSSISGESRTEAYKFRGDRYLAMRDYERALADYGQVIRRSVDDPGAYSGRAQAHLALGRFDLAMGDAESAVRLAPRAPGGYRTRCEIRVARNVEPEQAREDCDRAIEIDFADTAALSARGVLNLRSGDNAEAWEDFDSAIFNGRSDAQTLYGRGIAATRLGRAQEGAADIAAAEALNAQIGTVFATEGVSLP